MLKTAKICIVIVLFGQLGYDALTYYFHVAHPAYPAWAILFATTGMLAFVQGLQRTVSDVDLWFAAFIAWVTLNFFIAGESSPTQFTTMMLMYVVGPYVCGRFLGDKLRPSDVRLVYPLAGLMLLLIIFELIRDPHTMLDTDRLHVFQTEATQYLQAGIAFYVASLFGGAFIVALASLTFPEAEKGPADLGSKKINLAVGGVSLLLLILWGSRGSLVGILFICLALLLRKVRWSLPMLVSTLAGIAGVATGIYYMLPPERQAFVDQIPAGLAAFESTRACFTTSSGDSVLSHMTLLREAWRLFQQAPFFGIGASNFGFEWCGEKEPFVSPHSSIVHVLVELGLLGAIPWLMMFIGVVRMYNRSKKRLTGDTLATARCLFFLWVFFFLISQTSGNIYQIYQVYMTAAMVTAYILKHAQHSTGQIVDAPSHGMA